MRRWISILLAVILLLGSLSMSVLAEENDDTVENIDTVTEETVADETGEETAVDEEADETDETDESEPASDDEEAAADEDETEPEAAPEFVMGFVRVDKKTVVFEAMNESAVYAVLGAGSVVYAEVSMKTENVGNTWLKLTVETAAAKASGSEFANAYVRLKSVTPLTADEALALETELNADESVRLYRRHPLPVADMTIAAKPAAEEDEIAAEETAGEEDTEDGAADDISYVSETYETETVAITTQPKNTTAASGAKATFTVAATGATGYQWQVDRHDENGFVNLNNTPTYSGATTATLSVKASDSTATYTFRVKVTGEGGSVISNEVTFTLASKPAITAQPANATAAVGTSAVFTVTATGATGYQWQVNRGEGFVDLGNTASYKGVTTNTLTVTMKELFLTYKFRVVVSNAAGQTISNEVSVSLPVSKPSITSQPVNASAAVGAKATFTVEASNVNKYQWQVDRGAGFVDLGNTASYSGVTTKTLTVTMKELFLSYKFRVVLTNAGGQTISDEVMITIPVQPPVITAQPQNASAAVGAKATFTVEASNVSNYQWQVDRGAGFVDLGNTASYSGVTTKTLSVTMKELFLSYKFRVVLTNAGGETISDEVRVTLPLEKPVITAQPENALGSTGGTVSFTVAATGADSIQWQVDRKAGLGFVDLGTTPTFSGAATETLSVKVTANTLNYSFRAVLTNAAGSTISDEVSIQLAEKPTIVTQPTNQNGTTGGTVSFTVAYTGADSIQWQVNRNKGDGFVDLGTTPTFSGATTDTLTVKVTATTVTYTFRAVLTNAAGQTISNEVSIEQIVKPVITAQPVDLIVTPDQNAVFTIGYENADSIQWQVDRKAGLGFVDLGTTPTFSGATTDTLTVKINANTPSYSYRCVLTNAAGETISDEVSFRVVNLPAIVTQPTNQTAMNGEYASFTIAVEYADSIQWQVDRGQGFTDLGETPTYRGSTTETLQVMCKEATINYVFRAVVSNEAGEVISDEVTLSMAAAPEFDVQPVSQAVVLGETVTLTASSATADSIRWQADMGAGFVDLSESDDWQGVATDTLTFTATLEKASYSFRAVATNDAGETESEAVTIEVSIEVATANGVLVFKLVDGVLTLVSYTGSDASLTVSETIEGFTVKIIGANAFKNNTVLESIDLPDTIEIIGESAFENCSSLRSMN